MNKMPISSNNNILPLPSHVNIPSDLTEAKPNGLFANILIFLSIVLTILTFPISIFMSLKIVQQYERAVIFRLGKLKNGGARGPGLFIIVPCIDTCRTVDLRVISFQIPPQEILSKDSVTVEVDAVVYYRVCNAEISVVNIEDSQGSTKLLAQTTLRNVLGTKTLSEMLSDRDSISHQMETTLDDVTEHWGVKVERVEVKDVRLPKEMQRAMAAEAEANREAKAKIIAAKGEFDSSKMLREAALTISDTPAALQLRYLQTLNTISAEHNSTIIFPFPIDILSSFRNLIPVQTQQFAKESHHKIISINAKKLTNDNVSSSKDSEIFHYSNNDNN